MADADALFASAATGSTGSKALIDKRAQLRAELFNFGGLELTRSILTRYLELPEVALLLPEHARQSRKEAAEREDGPRDAACCRRFLPRRPREQGPPL